MDHRDPYEGRSLFGCARKGHVTYAPDEPDSGTPIQGQTARFLVGGAKRGEGFILLYPDNLTAVTSPVETWGYLVGPLIFLAITIPIFHSMGWFGAAIGSMIGGQAGEAISKRRAIKKAAAGGDGVTVIPLDLITGVQIRKPAGLAGRLGIRILAVTTADGMEYGFRGTTQRWQGHLARALTARGREVYTVQDSITVMPRISAEEG